MAASMAFWMAAVLIVLKSALAPKSIILKIFLAGSEQQAISRKDEEATRRKNKSFVELVDILRGLKKTHQSL